MSPSPVSEEDTAGLDQYSASWQAIMQLVRNGSSWSGYERNCCFLNTGDRFAAASHVSGLDFTDDGRGIAISDWDQDGDLDLWFRNRTAPRLRLMLNQSSDGTPRRYVAFRLVGNGSNRDAIGAVVELKIDGYAKRMVRSVRAGEMFLSQSSKWAHFGIPESGTIENVHVLWPGGERNTFRGIAAGNRYVLEQGKQSAVLIPPRPTVALETAPLPTQHASTGRASVVLPAPIPLPIAAYFDKTGKQVPLPVSRNARLLVLWSASCPHCKRELTQLANRAHQLDVLALCIDGNTSETRRQAAALIAETGFADTWGMVGAKAIERVQVLQQALFDKTPDFAVPLSLLLRPGNAIVAIYRGPLSQEVLSFDIQSVVTASDRALRNWAPPFPGRWFTTPAPPSFLPEMIARRIQARYPEDAVSYLHLAVEKSSGTEQHALLAELGRKHYSLARKFVTKQRAQEAEYHFLKSLEVAPENAALHNDFGTLLAQMGRS